jgi:hypothetical protein
MKKYIESQKSLTTFIIQLEIINYQDKYETSFILWIHIYFLYTLSALQYEHHVSYGEHADEIPILPML